MEKWFFINMSSNNISDGYPDFYFGAFQENCHYFKKRFPTDIEFGEILHDRIGSILLKDRVPDYNLVFIVSKPLKNILNDVEESEKALTSFLYYMNNSVESLSAFLSKKPNSQFVFELDEKVGPDNMGAPGSLYEKIHWLDHQPSNTKDYKIADSWPEPLKIFLANNTNGNSNLQYFARVKGIYFCRISLYRKKHEDYLHYLFSFLQLFVTDGTQKSVLTRISLNELDFEGNDIVLYFSAFCKQVNTSLDEFKRKIGQDTVDADLTVADVKNHLLQDAVNETKSKLSSYELSTDNLNCENVGTRIDQWVETFEQFTKNLPRVYYDFNTFLNKKSNLIDTSKKMKSGNLDIWKGAKIDLIEEHKIISGKIIPLSFDENKFVKEWREELSDKFTEIKKDVQRCPNQAFMLLVLIISLLFYAIASYTIISKIGTLSDYMVFFIITTLLYLSLSLFLYLKYKRESINKIKQKVRRLQQFNNSKVAECLEKLKQKANNQLNIYKLGILNQNISTSEKSLMYFDDQNDRIEMIRKRNENIDNIAIVNGIKKDFELQKEVLDSPKSIYNYIKVFDSKFEEVPIKLYKNLNDQNQDIQKFSNRNNSLKAIKITQK